MKQLTAVMLLLAGLCDSSTRAADNMAFKGTLTELPPCKINDDKPIEVNFGNEVVTTRVDGSNYRMAVNYGVTCTGQSSSAMKIQIQGTGAGFDSTVLQADKTDLGIALFNNDKKLALNTWLNFTYPTFPKLEAVPVKKTGATLVAGAFKAGALMIVDYQ